MYLFIKLRKMLEEQLMAYSRVSTTEDDCLYYDDLSSICEYYEQLPIEPLDNRRKELVIKTNNLKKQQRKQTRNCFYLKMNILNMR